MPAFSCAAKLGSHSWSIIIKYNRALSLQDHHNLITMNKLYLTRGWGEVRSVCLYAQSFAFMHISYMLLHLHVGSVNTSSEAQKIQTFQLPPFWKQHSVMTSMPLQGVSCNSFSAFAGTFNSSTWIIPPQSCFKLPTRSNLKSHLSRYSALMAVKLTSFQRAGRGA